MGLDLFNGQFLKNPSSKTKKIIIVNPQPDIVKYNLAKYIDLNNYKVEVVKDFETFVLNHIDNYLL